MKSTGCGACFLARLQLVSSLPLTLCLALPDIAMLNGFISSSPLPSFPKRVAQNRLYQSQASNLVCIENTGKDKSDLPTLSRRKVLKGLAAAFIGGIGGSLIPAIPKDALSRPLTEPDFLYDAKSGSFVPAGAIASLLRRDAGSRFDRCIVAAEIHDNMSSHAAQLSVIDSARLLEDGKQIIVGFEQFYRNHDQILEQYVKGLISVTSLLELTNWKSTWGYDASLYTPIFEYCRIYGIPMRGLNVPRQFVSQVSRYGIDSLDEELRELLPDNMDFSNRDHYDHFVRLVGEGHGGHIHDKSVLDRYYEIQVLWEEWMSQSVAMSLAPRPDTRMVALIGSGHVEGRYGFPDRIEKRCHERPYTIVPRPVSWARGEGVSYPEIREPERDIADLVWYMRRRTDLV